jgi:hypothetical protein
MSRTDFPEGAEGLLQFIMEELFPIWVQYDIGYQVHIIFNRLRQISELALKLNTLDEAVAYVLSQLPDGNEDSIRRGFIDSGAFTAAGENRTGANTSMEDTRDEIDDDIRNAGQIVDDLEVIIEDYVKGAVVDIVDVINDATGGIVDKVLDGIERGKDVITNVLDGIKGAIDKGRGILDDIWGIVSGGVDIEITNNIQIKPDVFEAVVGGIGDILKEDARQLATTLGQVIDGITGVLRIFVEEEARTTITIATSIGEQTKVQEESADELVEEVKQINDPTIEGTGASMAKSIGEVMEEGINRSDIKTAKEWYDGFSNDVFLDCTEQDLDDWIKQKGVIDGVSGKFVYEALQVVGKAMGMLSVGGALAAKELYEFSRCTPWEVLEPGDAILAYQRNLIDLDALKTELAFRGYNKERQETLIEAGYQVPDPASLYSMNLRSLPGGENLTDRFKDLGFNPTDAESLAALKFYIPGAQDLITMAVRDVFSPDIVEEYQQDADFPPDFEFWAKQQGISSDWAHKYWQAHWVLPSVQMGFEMLHRRVITETQLRGLMRAQDIIPGWRDELIAISYSPFTRVDIRRMHDTGVLSESEVYDAYRDIGYNDDKARTLTEFTVALNEDDPDDIEPLDGLTRSGIINGYKDGLYDRLTADGLLKDSGVGEDARLIYLNMADLDIERENRNALSAAIVLEFKDGKINFKKAMVQLALLGLTPIELGKIKIKLQIAASSKAKVPSKADISKMYKMKIVTRDEFIEHLDDLGYEGKWIEAYVQLIEKGKLSDA